VGRVLLIESDPASRKVLSTLLTEEGHAVTEMVHPIPILAGFLGGRDAGPWDLVITDVPESHWDPELTLIRQVVGRFPDTPIVYWSAKDLERGDDADSLGLAEIWMKPTHLAVLRERVKRLLPREADA
jgi:CheY-like chemotaxis protein